MDAAILGIVAAVVAVLAVVVILLQREHAAERRAWAAERERLTQLVAARDGREFAQIRRAVEPKPVEPKPEEPVMVGLGG